MTTVGTIILDNFTQGYLECALWSMPAYGEPRDADYNETPGDGVSFIDLPNETLLRAKEECERFQSENSALLEQAYETGIRGVNGWTVQEQAGHDFCLTRNGHGAGFWDGDYPKELGDKLTAASKAFGENDLYIGDDSKIYWERP